LDRIDIHIDVPSVETQKLVAEVKDKAENSARIQARVQKARGIQIKRFRGTSLKSNAEMTTKDVKSFCALSESCRTMLRSAIVNLNLSARAYFKVIKIARTIADLSDEAKILPAHLAEALQYRPKLE